MEITALNVGLTVGGLVLTNFGVKLGRAYPVLKKTLKLVSDAEEAKQNGVMTTKEKALLYDDVESLLKEAWSIVKGFFPNKSE